MNISFEWKDYYIDVFIFVAEILKTNDEVMQVMALYKNKVLSGSEQNGTTASGMADIYHNFINKLVSLPYIQS